MKKGFDFDALLLIWGIKKSKHTQQIENILEPMGWKIENTLVLKIMRIWIFCWISRKVLKKCKNTASKLRSKSYVWNT